MKKLVFSCFLFNFIQNFCFCVNVNDIRSEIEMKIKNVIAKRYDADENKIVLRFLTNTSYTQDESSERWEPQCAIFEVQCAAFLRPIVAKYCLHGFNCHSFTERLKQVQELNSKGIFLNGKNTEVVLPFGCFDIDGNNYVFEEVQTKDSILLMPLAHGEKIYDLLTVPGITEKIFKNCFKQLGISLAQLNACGFYHGSADWDNVLFSVLENDIKIFFIDIDDRGVHEYSEEYKFDDLQGFFIDLNPIASFSKESLKKFPKESNLFKIYMGFFQLLAPWLNFERYEKEVETFDPETQDEVSQRPIVKGVKQDSMLIFECLNEFVEAYLTQSEEDTGSTRG